MFALVIAGAEKVGLKSRPKSAVPVPLTTPKPVTLEEELAARGISTIPLAEVRAYQQEYMRQEQNAGQAGEKAEWTSYTPWEFRRATGVGLIPGNVGKTIRRAEMVPDARVRVERFFEDPFVFVVREKEGRREEACIAFWDAPGFKAK